MKNNFIAIALSVVAIVLATLSLASPGMKAGNTTASFWDATLGYKVNGTFVISSARAAAFTTGGFTGKMTLDGGLLRSYPNSTSTTATTQTFVEADFLNYDTVLLTPNTNSLTGTLMASSTMTNMIPTAGDRQDVCIFNATSTAGKNITLAAGTGIDLLTVATSTITGAGGVLAIAPQTMGCLTFVREADSDVAVMYYPPINAD